MKKTFTLFKIRLKLLLYSPPEAKNIFFISHVIERSKLYLLTGFRQKLRLQGTQVHIFKTDVKRRNQF